MKATLDIPDDVVSEVQRRAQRDGRELVEQFVQLVRLGLLASDAPRAEITYILRLLQAVRSAQARGLEPCEDPISLATDPLTGLPIIHSPPEAPIHSMTVDQVLALAQESLVEEDLERAGLSIRH